MLWSSDLVASLTPDVIRLRNFEKISLEPGETRTVTLSIPASDLAFVGYDGRWRLEKGDFRIRMGTETLFVRCVETRVWDTLTFLETVLKHTDMKNVFLPSWRLLFHLRKPERRILPLSFPCLSTSLTQLAKERCSPPDRGSLYPAGLKRCGVSRNSSCGIFAGNMDFG